MSVAENTVRVVRLKNGGTREFRSKEERRRIVEETLKSGASVALVARANGVNANQVFKWRRQYRKGRLEIEAPTTLVPVKISDAVSPLPRPARHKSKARKSGIIDIDLGHARVRIEGTADPECVRAALEGLAR
jgi:transposase